MPTGRLGVARVDRRCSPDGENSNVTPEMTNRHMRTRQRRLEGWMGSSPTRWRSGRIGRWTRPVWHCQSFPALSALLPTQPRVFGAGLHSAATRPFAPAGQRPSAALRHPAGGSFTSLDHSSSRRASASGQTTVERQRNDSKMKATSVTL